MFNSSKKGDSHGAPAFITNALDALSIGDYTLKPFDLVLFLGNDPVGKFIQSVELHDVVPGLKRPFHNLWTHAGMLVDKSVLNLPFLEEGKIYLYESIFSGEVLGYVYSKVLPLDHDTSKTGFHLGPQIRDFEAVVKEVDSDVAICPLDETSRERIRDLLAKDPDHFLKIYNHYKDFSYPMSVVPQLAAASEKLYKKLESVKATLTTHFPSHTSKKDAVFCSELVAIIYQGLLVTSFQNVDPGRHTPLSVEVQPEFDGRLFYAKEDKMELLKHGKKVPTKERVTRGMQWFTNLLHHVDWTEMPPDGGVPPNSTAAGYDIDNAPLYVCRVRIGDAVVVGKVRGDVPPNGLHAHQPPDLTPPNDGEKGPAIVTYKGDEVQIHFGHEVLTTFKNTTWTAAKDGKIPESAVPGGVDDEGKVLYIARAKMEKHVAKHGFGHVPILNSLVTEKRHSLCPGQVAEHLKGAIIPFDGDDHLVKEYEVLCYM
ncbi:hypothetical protein DFJ73DRAFT_848648 [Zopfochytrium polystomum]|nr:hypothetical protein DFJ73DRAFT_848648 [Zopfochytrium polystomum]